MWHIGQDIVCIKNHSQAIVKEGEIYQIKSITKGCCHIVLDVGINIKVDYIECTCGNSLISNGIVWIHESLFKPLDELSDISELLEVLEL